MKDLLVSIPTRNRPENLVGCLEMLYETCEDRKNFDVQVIIDNDQIDLYKDIIEQHPEFIYWTFVKHTPLSWLNIINAQHKLVHETNYYFHCTLSDDLRGLSRHWDRSILSKKKEFADDLFVLYTQTRLFRRHPDISARCYTWDPRAENETWKWRMLLLLSVPKRQRWLMVLQLLLTVPKAKVSKRKS